MRMIKGGDVRVICWINGRHRYDRVQFRPNYRWRYVRPVGRR